jgi:hypothetical protein
MTYDSTIRVVDLLQIKVDLGYINAKSAGQLSLLIVTNLLFKLSSSI